MQAQPSAVPNMYFSITPFALAANGQLGTLVVLHVQAPFCSAASIFQYDFFLFISIPVYAWEKL